MIEDERRVDKQDFMSLLNGLGFNVVLIGQTHYLFTEFVPADSTYDKTSLTAKDITTLVSKHVLGIGVDALKQRELLVAIENLPVLHREYSSHFEWIVFLG